MSSYVFLLLSICCQHTILAYQHHVPLSVSYHHSQHHNNHQYCYHKYIHHCVNNERIQEISQKLCDMDDSVVSLIVKISRNSNTTSLASTTTNTAPVNDINWITINDVITGLSVWKSSLSKGYTPEDFNWPDYHLYTHISSTFNRLNVPKLTLSHPELINIVLRNLLMIVIEYNDKVSSRVRNRNLSMQMKEEEESIIASKTDWWNYLDDDDDGGRYNGSEYSTDEDICNDIASYTSKKFESAWSPVLQGVTLLDELYGNKHGLLSPVAARPDGKDDKSGAGFGKGYGIFNGIWRHTGWKVISDIQNQLENLDELKELFDSLGRRASIDGVVKMKLHQQLPLPTGSKSVSISSLAPTETTNIKQGNSLEGLLMTEAMLLINKSNRDVDTTGVNVSTETNENTNVKKSKLLFLSKLSESLLFSYEKTGYIEQLSTLNKNRKYKVKMPTDRGGAIIICLDTSFSMTGFRETLAKAVVLQASISASGNHRPCYIIAFSGNSKRNIAQYVIPLEMTSRKSKGKRSSNKETQFHIEKLLDFLSKSFHGGTDVTAPLERALELIEDKSSCFASSDIILVTDGELQSPPVSKELVDRIRRLERDQSLQLHGLLIGRNDSVPLHSLCTNSVDKESRVHNFLYQFDPVAIAKAAAELYNLE